MNAPWFHIEHVPAVGDVVTLAAREARHATGARRLREDDPLCLFDGCGVVADARIAGAGDTRRVDARIDARREIPRPRPALHVASALPGGDRQGTMLGMLTQLAVASFTPLQCSRNVAHATDRFADRAMRVCLEACKQSRNPHAPEIRDAVAPPEIAGLSPVALVAHPGGPPVAEVLGRLCIAPPPALHVLVGPEGGFTEEEVDAIRVAGAQSIGLGSSILRIETAAVALVAALRFVLGDAAAGG